MDKYYKKSIEDLKVFRNSINENVTDESITKVKALMKEWFDNYSIKKNKEINNLFNEKSKELNTINNKIKEQMSLITETLKNTVKDLIKNTENTIEINIINKFSKMNHEFLNELLHTQKELVDTFNKKINSFNLSSKQDIHDFIEKINIIIENLVTKQDFLTLQEEFYTQMTEIKLPEEKKKYYCIEENYSVGMLLESTGTTTDTGELIVKPSTENSKVIIGTYNTECFFDESLYQNVLLIDTNGKLEIGDFLTTSKMNGFGQKSETFNEYTFGKVITNVNWINMIEINGVLYNTGIAMCKIFN